MDLVIRETTGAETVKPLHVGYNYIRDSFGVYLADLGDGTMAAEFGNGYVGRGEPKGFHYARIILRLTEGQGGATISRIAHYQANPAPGTNARSEIGFGTGNSFFPPGAVKILRFTVDGSAPGRCYVRPPKLRKHRLLATPRALTHLRNTYDAVAVRIMTALRTGMSAENVRAVTDWAYYGDPQAGAAGGEGIDPYPGWQGSSAYALLVHDLTMERHAVQYRDATTGSPLRLAGQGTYRATGGRNAWTVHAEYVNEDFTDKGSNRHPEYDRIDDQHLVRAIAPAKVSAIMYGDPIAARSLDMIAADAWMGLDKKPVREGGMGSGYGRGFAWTLDALVAAQEVGFDYHNEIGFMVRAASHVQMPNGLWFRAESKDEGKWSFAPSPWTTYGLGREYGASQIMEGAYLACAMHNAGASPGASRAYVGMRNLNALEPIRKWGAVSINGAVQGRIWPQVGVTESFWLWPLLGIAGTPTEMEAFVPPGAGMMAGEDVRQALLKAGNFNASAKALERLES